MKSVFLQFLGLFIKTALVIFKYLLAINQTAKLQSIIWIDCNLNTEKLSYSNSSHTDIFTLALYLLGKAGSPILTVEYLKVAFILYEISPNKCYKLYLLSLLPFPILV
jgi:hypothetical protein